MFGKYAWVIPIKDKKGTSVVNVFKKIISKESEAESKGRRFIRTLKNKIFEHMRAISKNVYFDVLDFKISKKISKNFKI